MNWMIEIRKMRVKLWSKKVSDSEIIGWENVEWKQMCILEAWTADPPRFPHLPALFPMTILRISLRTTTVISPPRIMLPPQGGFDRRHKASMHMIMATYEMKIEDRDRHGALGKPCIREHLVRIRN